MGAIVDFQTAFNLAIMLGAFLGGWVLNTIWQTIKDVETAHRVQSTEIGQIKVLIAGTYMTRTEHADAMQHVTDALRRIEDKLDRKQDR